MVLYMSYQRSLLPKSTLGNGLADQTAVRKVGAAHRLLFSFIFEKILLSHTSNFQGDYQVIVEGSERARMAIVSKSAVLRKLAGLIVRVASMIPPLERRIAA